MYEDEKEEEAKETNEKEVEEGGGEEEASQGAGWLADAPVKKSSREAKNSGDFLAQ